MRLWNIEWAQWYIKLNVIMTFHKIWIAAEDKWKMTFCMRYELYKWMMTSFELVNVSSTFQRYINWALWDFLNGFCSVWICWWLQIISARKWYWNCIKRWLQNEWLRCSYNSFIELMSFYHNSLKLRHSVCEQSMKRESVNF
jgi:hypothetical protein